MTKTIALEDLEHELHEVIDEVAAEHSAYVVTRGNHPRVALVSYDDFEKLVQWEESRVLADFDALLAKMTRQNAQFSDEEVARDVDLSRSYSSR